MSRVDQAGAADPLAAAVGDRSSGEACGAP